MLYMGNLLKTLFKMPPRDGMHHGTNNGPFAHPHLKPAWGGGLARAPGVAYTVRN